MSERSLFDSASGLRPVSAFLVIASVLGLVGVKVGLLATLRGEGQPPRVLLESDPAPAYSIHDRDGRALASFVQRLDLVLSPNAMWQAHTPDAMAERIGAALGGSPSPGELSRRFLPDARDGVVSAQDPLTGLALLLTLEQAQRVDAWARTGRLDGKGPPRSIDGIWLEEQRDHTWMLCWAPAVTLREDMRARHMPARRHNPLSWTRFLADGLAGCLLGERALPRGGRFEDQELERQRAWIWSALLPCTWTVAVQGFDARHGPALAALFARERVAQHQMRIERGRTRRYPSGRSELLGFWGHLDRPRAQLAALRELGVAPAELSRESEVERTLASLDAGRQSIYAASLGRLLREPSPLLGLERACDRLLAGAEWSFLDRSPAAFAFLQHRPAGRTARTYFLAASAPSETPRVVTTIDALLQRQVGAELDRVIASHAPALAMAIVLDLEDGDVLAADARSPYQLEGWAPVHHQYPPGSTFKVAIMAAALESGQVSPHDVFDVGDGRGYDHLGRIIHEAENSRTGRLTAAECLAHSVNAGLVQIGQRVPAEFLHGRLRALHYGDAPRTGLGGESPGWIPPLPWDRKYRHASVSFGYETQVTLWQHAAALSAILRGGEWRPLRLIAAVEQAAHRWPVAAPAAERVFSAATCAELRSMLELAATVGTGAPLAGPAHLPGLVVGTKTGTAQKVPGEVCLHRELADQVRHHLEETRCSRACRQALRAGSAHPGRECLTLSMAVAGRRASGGRQVLVLVVVDEPTRKGRYGSDTAGPLAVALIKEALGVTALGAVREEPWIAGFRRGRAGSEATSEQPWAEVAW